MTNTLTRRGFAGLSLAGVAGGLAGCATPDPRESEQRDMGDFQLGFTVVVADNIKKIPPSRDASPEAWKAVMTSELERRFGPYQGGKEYVVALAIDGYALAPPGIPVVLTPKSILVVSANVWEANPQQKIGGPEQITTFEGADTLLLGSGLVKTAEEQMETLARNMAFKVQSWMLRNGEWFGLVPRP
ncbi:hypothetical protein JANAI62_02720 [Jannaschia pagri]|uniref:Uncharacterized protein n=1 Tax=Jannaschia pagri TaxID=2829797 RepID=A0ABQ4NGU5_9RHOB|nr:MULTISPECIES: hypothetical protein [unclassified Jannaschia]GIT90245.1 hypothetical protein JANAI61_07030 [Jannaschia sp. AI_61]GIT93649.1 hypothetical protein JANAI62_02720 [Jannaschia sp. AI_62]